jgi:predicted dehydrogenase
MSERTGTSRRAFLKHTGAAAAAGSILAGAAVPHVHAAESNTIQLALIGCGGRGGGAAKDALQPKNGPLKLVAMADVFENKLNAAYGSLIKERPEQVDVPKERRFVSFDGYKKAIDCLKPGDVAIMATPPAFRWAHFTYAIAKGVNVFMEKPITVDGPSTRRMLKLGEEAKKKNLKVGVGLMCRHCEVRGELFKRIKDGMMGDIITMRAYRLHGPIASFESGPKPDGISELLYQIQRFHSFLWASGGCYSDYYIHNIDECCWMKDAWPVKAEGVGGRHYRGDKIDQNFDNYSTEFTFADGTKLYMEGRCIAGCHDDHSSFAHGSKGSAIISHAGHAPSKARIYRTQKIDIDNTTDIVWQGPPPKTEPNPYLVEWNHLIDAIRNDKPYNEVERGAKASLVTAMGRMACHTGQVITFDQMLNGEHEFAPQVDQLTMTSPAPLQLGKNGKYPVPMPGLLKDREYLA